MVARTILSAEKVLEARTTLLPGLSYKTGGSTAPYGLDVSLPVQPDADEARMCLRIPFADGRRRDGVGDLLEVGGIRLERHKLNPVVLFDHGKNVVFPIALAEDRDTNEYTVGLHPETQQADLLAFFYQGKGMAGVARDEEYEHAVLCSQLFHMACKRLIRSGSIGYQVIKANSLEPNYETGSPKGLHLLSVLMLEGSLVVMPANMDTVQKDYGPTAREILGIRRMCGKPLSPMLVKSFQPFAAMETKTTVGFSGMKSLPEAELRKLAEKHDDGMGYGQLYIHQGDGKVWLAMGDWWEGDDDLEAGLTKLVGKDNWQVEAEAFPPKDEGWQRIYPDKGKKAMTVGTKSGQDPKQPNKLPAGHRPKPLTIDKPPKQRPSYLPPLPEKKPPTKNLTGASKTLALRRKYAGNAKGLRRRVKCSKPGSSILYAGTKDLEEIKRHCADKGVKVDHLGPCTRCGKGIDKLRLTGDDSTIDGVARAFGKRVKLKTMHQGVKSMTMKRRVKAAPDEFDRAQEEGDDTAGVQDTPGDVPEDPAEGTDLGEEEEKGLEGEEKYSLQVLKRMHQDASILLEEYDEMSGPLEHEEISAHLQTKLEDLVQDIEEIEGLVDTHHPGTDLGMGGMGGKEMGAPPGDAGEQEEEAEEPTPEEAMEGMKKPPIESKEKRLASRLKRLKARRKALMDPAADTDLGEEEDQKRPPEDGGDPAAATDLGVEEDQLQPHHHKALHGAHGFLSNIPNMSQFGDQDRMEAYHHHKSVEGIVEDLEGHHPDEHDVPGHEEHQEKPGEDFKEGDLKAMPHHHRPAPHKRGHNHHDKKDMSNAGGEAQGEQAGKPVEMLKHASGFLKQLSLTRDFGDLHRHAAAGFAKGLGDMMGSALGGEEEEKDEPDGISIDQADEETNVTEPGERGEKTNGRVVKQLHSSFATQQKAIAALNDSITQLANRF